jgi:hypothetical protein
MKSLDRVLLAPESWRPEEPSSGRESNRTCERELERTPACLVIDSREYPVRLWDYSPFGFSCLYPQALQPSAPSLAKGDPARICLDIGSGWRHADCVVENTGMFKGQLRVGLRRTDWDEKLPEASESLNIGDSLILWGETPNPLLFGEWCSLRLVAVRPGLRLVFTSADPSLVIFPGMEMDIELGVPTSGDNTYRGRVKSIVRNRSESITLLLEPIRVSAKLAGELGELLAMESGASPDDLRLLGLPVAFLRERLVFRYAEATEDMERVLSLRALSAESADGIASLSNAAGPPGRPDRTIRILCAYHEETLVAAATLGFPSSRKDRLHAEAGLRHEDIGSWCPGRESLMEIIDVSTHPHYRRGDLWLALAERIARIFLLSDRERMVRSCEHRLVPLYERIGFRRKGAPVDAGSRKRQMVSMDRKAILRAKGVGLRVWLTLYSDLVADVVRKDLVELSAWEWLRLRARMAWRPWLRSRNEARAEQMFRQCILK